MAHQVDRASGGWRLNRYLARAGIASRRSCDLLIAQGAVMVNGAVERSPGARVKAGDAVSCMGREYHCPYPGPRF